MGSYLAASQQQHVSCAWVHEVSTTTVCEACVSCMQYEPTIEELRHKYEVAMKEKMLVRLEKERLQARTEALEAQVKPLTPPPPQAHIPTRCHFHTSQEMDYNILWPADYADHMCQDTWPWQNTDIQAPAVSVYKHLT